MRDCFLEGRILSTGGDAHSLSICGTLVLELLVQVWAEESNGLGEGDGLG